MQPDTSIELPCMSEDQIQQAVFDHLRERGIPGLVAFHPKNGGVTMIRPLLGKIYTLELKREGEKPTPEQEDFMAAVHRAGGVAGWAAGLDAALAWLEDHNLVCGVSRGTWG